MAEAMTELSSLAQPGHRERLIHLVRQLLGPPGASRPLPIDARLADLGLNSLKMVNLMLAIEGEFNLSIPQAAITPENFASIGTIEIMIRNIEASASSL